MIISVYSIKKNHYCTEKHRMILDDKELRSKTKSLTEKNMQKQPGKFWK